MKRVEKIMFAVLLGQLMLLTTGCSVIGYRMGERSDAKKGNKQEYSGEALSQTPINSEIKIFLKNGQVQKGRLLRFSEQKEGEENVKSIMWNDLETYRQVSTDISTIERVVVKPRKNGKWVGLGIGGALDVISFYGLKGFMNFLDSQIKFNLFIGD